ncbi:MAG: tRNA ((6)-L-threonylcarbamoyladenosine(37)-C(2))-methylthiotransferase MtaB [Bacteroidota bacterium]|jgi:threonylcarbamoyladenosine tRNA methylthiotransferase MtaB
MQKVAFHTLGCKLNFSETSTIARQFKTAGWVKVEFDQPADVYVINTCSVTENADRECRSYVNKAMVLNPSAHVVVVGCYAQLKPSEIASIPGVSLVLGATEKFNILNFLAELESGDKAKVMSCEIEEATSFTGAWSSDDRTRSFLKVQDGCDYNCSFCTIPLARGHSRSNTIKGVLHDVERLVSSGVREIVLTGVNLGDFGISDSSGKHVERFSDLVHALDQSDHHVRFRISSIEPNLLTNEVIRVVADSGKFMPHFHMPLQSGSDEILAKMRRRYMTDLYAEKVSRIRELIPHASIGVDVIVGFPGESEAHFAETFEFLHALPVSYFHVFTYSERLDTLAVTMSGVVPYHVRKERNRRLRNLSAKKMHDFTSGHIGLVMPVLFEAAESGGKMLGYTPNYIRVEHPYDPTLVNTVVDCHLSEIGSKGAVQGEVVTRSEPVLL